MPTQNNGDIAFPVPTPLLAKSASCQLDV